jgi:hypothetical protein
MLFFEHQSAKLIDVHSTCHPERSLGTREANRQTKSKACPELVEGEPMPSCGAPGNDRDSQVALGLRRAGRI